MGLEHGVVQKSGAWFAYGEERLGQGRENAKQFLRENEEVRGRILAEVYDRLGFDQPGASHDGHDAGREGEAQEEPAGRLT
jgi:recombination protein RecA